MNSKRKDLQYASVFLLAVALTFLLGKGDNLWLVSWGDLIPSLFVLFIAGDCLHSSLLRIKRGEEDGGARWSTCFTFLVFSIVFMGDLFYIGNFIELCCKCNNYNLKSTICLFDFLIDFGFIFIICQSCFSNFTGFSYFSLISCHSVIYTARRI